MKNYKEFKEYLKDMSIVTGGLVGAIVPTEDFLNNLEIIAGIAPATVPDEVWEALRNEEYWDCSGLTESGADALIGSYDDYDLFIAVVTLVATYPAEANCWEEHFLELKFQGCSCDWIAGYHAGGGFRDYHRANDKFALWMCHMYAQWDYWADGVAVY